MTDASPTHAATDVPLGGLPSAGTTLLANAPLEVAIIEVRFTPGRAELSVDTVPRIRDALATALGIDFPTIQPATQGTMQIDFNSSGASWSGDETKGWQVASLDGQHSAMVFPSSLTWQVGDYKRWSLSM